MKKHTQHDSSQANKNRILSKGAKNRTHAKASRDHDSRHRYPQAQLCIERGLNDISVDQFLECLPRMIPGRHEPILTVLKDDELRPIFRQRAAEAFCMGDKAYFLNNIPLYPLCFAKLRGAYGCCPEKHHVHYSFDDLADIAEEIIKHAVV